MSACSCHTLIHRLKMQLKVDKSTKDSPFAHKILAAESWWKLQAAILGISPFITSCFVKPIWYTFTSPGVVWQQNELRQKLLHDLVPSYVASLELIPSNSCSVWLNKWTSYWPLRSRRVGESRKLFYFSLKKREEKDGDFWAEVLLRTSRTAPYVCQSSLCSEIEKRLDSQSSVYLEKGISEKTLNIGLKGSRKTKHFGDSEWLLFEKGVGLDPSTWYMSIHRCLTLAFHYSLCAQAQRPWLAPCRQRAPHWSDFFF